MTKVPASSFLLLLISLQILCVINGQTNIYSACPTGINNSKNLLSLQAGSFCSEAFKTEPSLVSTNPPVCVPSNETAAHEEAYRAYKTDFEPNLTTFWDQTTTCGPKAKVFICLHYFPRVDSSGNVLKICKSTCDNYFKTCGSAYQTDFKCVNATRFDGVWNEGKGPCTGGALSSHQGVWKMLAFSSAGLLMFFAVNLLL